MAVAAGFSFLCLAPGAARAQSTAPPAIPNRQMAPRPTQPANSSIMEDDFAGLNYTDEQKAEIDKIHAETKAHEDLVSKDEKLNADQKDAMLLGYTRLEYGQIYTVLTPEQKKQVQKKIHARRAADEAAKMHTPPNKN